MVEQSRAWHAIIALGQHGQFEYVGRGMTSWPLRSTHGRTTLGVACHFDLRQNIRSDYIKRRIPSYTLILKIIVIIYCDESDKRK